MGSTGSKSSSQKQQSKQQQQQQQQDKLAKLLDKGILGWSAEEVSLWLELRNMPDLAVKALELRIDGECIAECDNSTLQQWFGCSPLPDRFLSLHNEDILSNHIVKILLSDDEVKQKQQRHDNNNNNNMEVEGEGEGDNSATNVALQMNECDLSKDREKLKKLIMYYHSFSANTTKGGAPSLKRDWHRQPKTLRRYYTSPLHLLPLPPFTSQPGDQISSSSSSLYTSKVLTEKISQLMYYAYAMSANQDDHQSSMFPRSVATKRVNPSSGGLHPLELYVYLPSTPPSTHGGSHGNDGDDDGGDINMKRDGEVKREGDSEGDDQSEEWKLYHYSVRNHGLEMRSKGIRIEHYLPSSSPSSSTSSSSSSMSVGVGLSSIDYREVWKYGVRGWRYCQLDIGHAIASLMISMYIWNWRLEEIFEANHHHHHSTFASSALFLSSQNDDYREDEYPILFFHISTSPYINHHYGGGGGDDDNNNGDDDMRGDVSPLLKRLLCAFANQFNTSKCNELKADVDNNNDNDDIIIGSPNIIFNRSGKIVSSSSSSSSSSSKEGNWPELPMIRRITSFGNRYLHITSNHQSDNNDVNNNELSSSSSPPIMKRFSKQQWANAVRDRRSVIDFDERNRSIKVEELNTILCVCYPPLNSSIFKSLHTWMTFQDIIIFFWVNEVEGMEVGLYALPLSPHHSPPISAEWKRYENDKLDAHLPLYHLQSANAYIPPDISTYYQQKKKKKNASPSSSSSSNNNDDNDDDILNYEAYESSCYQNIAKDSAVTFAFFGDFNCINEKQTCYDPHLHPHHPHPPSDNNQPMKFDVNPHAYQTLHWQAGFIGHLIYVTSYLLSFGCTGMGCFLDDLSLLIFSSFFTAKKVDFHYCNDSSDDDDNNNVNIEVEGFDDEMMWKPLYHMAIGKPSFDNRYQPYNYNDRKE